jgi:hypothetical protein
VKRTEGPGKCLVKDRSWFAWARRSRRALRGKLGGGNEANNGTGGQMPSFYPASPVASIRWEALLVRGERSNPVRKNREAAGRNADENSREKQPVCRSGSCKIPRGAKHALCRK